MIRNTYSTKVIAALISVLSTCLSAEKAHHNPKQEVHLHGRVEITLVIEGNTVELHLESPAANIVGFEHPASTPKQLDSINRATTILEAPEQLLTFIGTRCLPTVREIDVSAVSPAKANHNEAHPAHQTHLDKGHATHSEISARYQFNCTHGNNLTAIKVQLFDLFPRIESIHAAWINDHQQALTTLTAGSTTIKFKNRP